MDNSPYKDISSLLRAFFDDETVGKGKRYANVFGGWRQVAGERFAAHSRIVEIERNFLVVEADHPGWIQLLQLRQSQLLSSVQHRFPELELKGIVFRLAKEIQNSSGRVDAVSDLRALPEKAEEQEGKDVDGDDTLEPLDVALPEGEFKDSLERLRTAVEERARNKPRFDPQDPLGPPRPS